MYHYNISTHAPHARRDPTQKSMDMELFISTHTPRARRDFNKIIQQNCVQFQLTRTSWGGRKKEYYIVFFRLINAAAIFKLIVQQPSPPKIPLTNLRLFVDSNSPIYCMYQSANIVAAALKEIAFLILIFLRNSIRANISPKNAPQQRAHTGN